MTETFAPGDLVYARGREWVAMPSPDEEILCLRPLSGTEADLQVLLPALEREPVRHARFEMPDLAQTATQDAARLLSQALQLSVGNAAAVSAYGSGWWPKLKYAQPPGSFGNRRDSLTVNSRPWNSS